MLFGLAFAATAQAENLKTRSIGLQPLNMPLWALVRDEYSSFAVLELPIVLTIGEEMPGEWIFEGTWSYAIVRDSPFNDAFAAPAPRRTDQARFIGSAGRAFRPLRGGFFVTPKTMLVIGAEGATEANPGETPLAPRLGGPRFQASLGVDLGYRWQWDRWILAVVVGASFGYVWTSSPAGRGLWGSLISPLGSTYRASGSSSRNLVVDLNLNLVRFSYRF